MDNEEIFLEEQKALKNITDDIDARIEVCEKGLSGEMHTIIGFTEGLRGTQFNRQAMMSLYATEANRLKSIRNNPYFGRFDFKENDTSESEINYIGKKLVMDVNRKILVNDWRSNKCSMYYDNNIGPASYIVNGIEFKGELLKKRQIIIKKGKLEKVLEQESVTDDKILLECLSENADARLKSIIATIQKEQNRIIRSSIKNNYIVQGVAGSGKTTVALHRIAYLLYNEAKNIKENDFMIIGPNKYFLNYISELLPELDVNNVEQNTFEDIAMNIIKGKFKTESKNIILQKILLNEVNSDVIKYKNSIEYLRLIEKFIYNYLVSNLQKPIQYEGINICEVNSLKNIYSYENSIGTNSYSDRIKIFSKKLIKIVKEKEDDLSYKYWELNKKPYLILNQDDPKRKEFLEKNRKVKETFKKGCPNQIKEYFNFMNANPVVLYKLFLESIEESDISLSINMKELKDYTLSNLNNKTINSDDLAAILYISYLINGVSKYNDYSHVIIDEAQDLSLAQYYVLKKIFPTAIFDIYGDVAQSIYSYQGIQNWNELNEKIFNSKAEKIELNKSYRTTMQVSNVSNLVLEKLEDTKSECISRDGKDVVITEVDSNDNETTLIYQINEILKNGYETIAIICKDDNETLEVYKSLVKKGLNVNIVSENNEKYTGGLCIVPSYLSKGLEFDAVILYDANNINYQENSIDMKLLYVSITRAMHELYINYSNQITNSLSSLVKEDNKVLIKSR